MAENIKLKNRAGLARYFAELSFKKGAEVGVFKGNYSLVLIKTIPNLNLLCVDSWSTDSGWGLEKNEAAYPEALKNLTPHYNATILKGSSVYVSNLIQDQSLDFVYIDADHTYEAVKSDINAWAPKVRKGGIISGHDYFEPENGTVGVIPAVDEFARQHNLKVQATDWDEENQSRDDRQPSWYIIL